MGFAVDGDVGPVVGVVGPQECEDFLVFSCGEGDLGWFVGFGLGRMDGRREVTKSVLDPAVEDAGFPGLVEGGFAEGGGSGGAGGPGVAAVGG